MVVIEPVPSTDIQSNPTKSTVTGAASAGEDYDDEAIKQKMTDTHPTDTKRQARRKSMMMMRRFPIKHMSSNQNMFRKKFMTFEDALHDDELKQVDEKGAAVKTVTSSQQWHDISRKSLDGAPF